MSKELTNEHRRIKFENTMAELHIPVNQVVPFERKQTSRYGGHKHNNLRSHRRRGRIRPGF